MNSEFIKRVQSVQKPPCEEFNCKFQKKCATEHLACLAFSSYVSGSTRKLQYHQFKSISTPTKEIYKMIFSREEI